MGTKSKRKPGRPKITTDDFPQYVYDKKSDTFTATVGDIADKLKQDTYEWYEVVLREMSEGASLVEIKAILNIANDTHDRMMKEDDEYMETIKKGIRLSESWWQRSGRKSLRDKDFNYTGWYMNMKNRFGWRDRHDHTSDDERMEGFNIYKPEVSSD